MTDKISNVGTYQYVAEPFHVDFLGNLSMSVLGNNLLNCAEFHSTDRGFGIAKINQENYTWVLSRLAIELEDMPQQFEEYTIETWVENVYRLFTDRNYALYNSNKVCIGYARSIWAMINLNSRKPENLIDLHGGDISSYIEDKPCPIEKPSRIKVSSQQEIATIYTKYTDIDINGHVNSVRYIDYILNLFSLEKFKKFKIQRFEIAYIAESYFGDELSFYLDELSSTECHVEVRRNKEEVVCRSKIIFKPSNTESVH